MKLPGNSFFKQWINKIQMAQNTGLNKSKVSPDDVHAISHINYVTNGIHDLANELYEDLMERDHEKAKIKASNICKLMSDLIHSMTDEI